MVCSDVPLCCGVCGAKADITVLTESVVDKYKHLRGMHLKFNVNVRWHRNGFADALNACRHPDSRHDSPSLIPSSALSLTLVRR